MVFCFVITTKKKLTKSLVLDFQICLPKKKKLYHYTSELKQQDIKCLFITQNESKIFLKLCHT